MILLPFTEKVICQKDNQKEMEVDPKEKVTSLNLFPAKKRKYEQSSLEDESLKNQPRLGQWPVWPTFVQRLFKCKCLSKVVTLLR